MSLAEAGPALKRMKMCVENEDDSNDVDNVSQVEVSDSDPELREAVIRASKFDPGYARIQSSPDNENGVVVESASKSVKQASKKDKSFEEPPLKKVKFSPSYRDETENFRESSVTFNEDISEKNEFDCDYENISANFFSEELTSDDEILTFHCPKDFDVKSLLNKSIDLSKDTKLKIDCSKYILQTVKTKKRKKIDCVLPSTEKGAVIMKLPVAGHIVLRKSLKLPKKKVGSFVDYNVESIQAPSLYVQKRHPLLGTEWNDHFNKVKKQIKKHKKFLRRSLKHEKSLEKSVNERKEQKKKLKVELALLKKKQISEVDN